MTAAEYQKKYGGKKAKQTASQLENAICRYLQALGHEIWPNPTVGVWDQKKQVYRKRKGPTGLPDLLGLLAPQGQFIGIEVKVGKDTLKAHQKYRLQRIRDAGGIAFVARSLQDVIDRFPPPEKKR